MEGVSMATFLSIFAKVVHPPRLLLLLEMSYGKRFNCMGVL